MPLCFRNWPPPPHQANSRSIQQEAEARAAKVEKCLALKKQGNARFVKGDVKGALVACLASSSSGQQQQQLLPDTDSAKCHSNIAACLLKLGGEVNAAKALRTLAEAAVKGVAAVALQGVEKEAKPISKSCAAWLKKQEAARASKAEAAAATASAKAEKDKEAARADSAREQNAAAANASVQGSNSSANSALSSSVVEAKLPEDVALFQHSDAFAGCREGIEFRAGAPGAGYYADKGPAQVDPVAVATAAIAAAKQAEAKEREGS
jgi:colicin import membrane protein